MGETGGAGEMIIVSVRLRPLNRREIVRNNVSDWECFGGDTIVYKNASHSVPERSMYYPSAYTFDRVFGYDASTRQVYQDGAKDVVLSVLSGINASIFAYGETSSGKTFTMTGITEYTLADIYDYIQKHPDWDFHLKFSALEIYNESVRDLLSNDDYPLRLLDDPQKGTVVENITEESVRDWDHVMELLSVCEAQRQIGDTSLNETSSKSHQIIRLTIESQPCNSVGRDSASTLVSTVNFVDLAGSERASQSLTTGTSLKEGCQINRSLLTLETVIRKLSKGKNGHIPFRDSKLTRILQSSLGGNSRTAIICTMSPARSHVEQSRNTLLFASCAKVSTNADKALVKHLQREFDRLENEMLREKDNQIEMMKNQIDELIAERDEARLQVQDLLRVVEDDDDNSVIRLGPEEYPHIRVQVSTEAEIYMPDTSAVVDPRQSFDGSSRYSPRGSESSFEENYIQDTEFELNSHPNTSPIRPMIRIAQSSETDSCHDSDDEIDEKSNRNSPELTDYIPKAYAESYSSSPDTKLNDVNSPFKEDETVQLGLNSVNEEDDHVLGFQQSFKLPKSRSYHEDKLENNNTPPNGDDQYYTGRPLDNPTKSCTFNCGVEFEKSNINNTDKEPQNQIPAEENDTSVKSNINNTDNEPKNKIPAEEDDDHNYDHNDDQEVVNSPFKEDKTVQLELNSVNEDDHVSGFQQSFKLPKSRSCHEGKRAAWVDKLENNNTPPNGNPLGNPTKSCTLNCGVEFEKSNINHTDKEPEPENKIPAEEDDTPAKSSIISQTKEFVTQNDSRIEDTQVTSIEGIKSVKSIAMDPIEDCSRSSTSSNWPSEFKKLQKELIELWHECNASIVHRTYFFLLFKGDQSDSIYMEVERKRLAFIKNTFARGNQAVDDGRTITRASSERDLKREREMLTKQMQKKLTEHERESLFKKWGIKSNTKYRRNQLANKLWSRVDMDHVADSAAVVAKLVKLVSNPGHAHKEMFGLNFTAPSSRKSYSFRNLIPLL